jgi:hypothetical protein
LKASIPKKIESRPVYEKKKTTKKRTAKKKDDKKKEQQKKKDDKKKMHALIRDALQTPLFPHLVECINQFVGKDIIQYNIIDRSNKRWYTLYAGVTEYEDFDLDYVITYFVTHGVTSTDGIPRGVVIFQSRWIARDEITSHTPDPTYTRCAIINYQFHQHAFNAVRHGIKRPKYVCRLKGPPWNMVSITPCPQCPNDGLSLYIKYTLKYQLDTMAKTATGLFNKTYYSGKRRHIIVHPYRECVNGLLGLPGDSIPHRCFVYGDNWVSLRSYIGEILVGVAIMIAINIAIYYGTE